MHRIKVRNGTNATLPVKARVHDKVKGHPVESTFSILPKSTKTLESLHFFIEEFPPGITVLWSMVDPPAQVPAARVATQVVPSPEPAVRSVLPQPTVASAIEATEENTRPGNGQIHGGNKNKGVRE